MPLPPLPTTTFPRAQYASPATISRCGMVYVDPKNLGYRPFYVRWVKMRCATRPTEAGLLMDLYDKYVFKCIEYILEGDLGDGSGEFEERLSQVCAGFMCVLGLVRVGRGGERVLLFLWDL